MIRHVGDPALRRTLSVLLLATVVVAGCGSTAGDGTDNAAQALVSDTASSAAPGSVPAEGIATAPTLPPAGVAVTPATGAPTTAAPTTAAALVTATTAVPTTAVPTTAAPTTAPAELDILALHNLEVQLKAGTIDPASQRPIVAGYVTQLEAMAPTAGTPQAELLTVLRDLDGALVAGDTATAASLAAEAHGLAHSFSHHD